jgi:peptidylprolyl isomerase
MALERPQVDPGEGAPPADLVVEDITFGEGPEAQPGQVATVHYVGVSFSSGKEFDASWNRGSRSASRSAAARSSPDGTAASRA